MSSSLASWKGTCLSLYELVSCVGQSAATLHYKGSTYLLVGAAQHVALDTEHLCDTSQGIAFACRVPYGVSTGGTIGGLADGNDPGDGFGCHSVDLADQKKVSPALTTGNVSDSLTNTVASGDLGSIGRSKSVCQSEAVYWAPFSMRVSICLSISHSFLLSGMTIKGFAIMLELIWLSLFA